jgi:hypothetical protein
MRSCILKNYKEVAVYWTKVTNILMYINFMTKSTFILNLISHSLMIRNNSTVINWFLVLKLHHKAISTNIFKSICFFSIVVIQVHYLWFSWCPLCFSNFIILLILILTDIRSGMINHSWSIIKKSLLHPPFTMRIVSSHNQPYSMQI